jgi:hypothetical protein
MANAALRFQWHGLANDPFWSLLLSFTDQPRNARYAIGNSASMVAHTEYGRPDPTRAEMAGHMLPLAQVGSHAGLDGRLSGRGPHDDLEADIALAIEAAQNRWRMSLLQRLIEARRRKRRDQRPLDYRPFAWLCDDRRQHRRGLHPAQLRRDDLHSAHEHYVPIAGGVFTTAVFTDAAAELREHGHEPPYEFLIGPSDEPRSWP